MGRREMSSSMVVAVVGPSRIFLVTILAALQAKSPKVVVVAYP